MAYWKKFCYFHPCLTKLADCHCCLVALKVVFHPRVTQTPYLRPFLPCWCQRLNGKRSNQVLSALDKLINVSQFIIRALSSPCQSANGNINHGFSHRNPPHISLLSVDSSSPNTTPRPANRSVWNQMSNTIGLTSKQWQTWPTYRAPRYFRGCFTHAFYLSRLGGCSDSDKMMSVSNNKASWMSKMLRWHAEWKRTGKDLKDEQRWHQLTIKVLTLVLILKVECIIMWGSRQVLEHCRSQISPSRQ